MKYFSRPVREAAEARYLAERHDKRFEPFGQLNLGQGARLGTEGVELHLVEGEWLAIEPETAAWAFLSAAEAGLYRRLDGMLYGQLCSQWPETASSVPLDFVAQLYRRGLLTVNGHGAIDSGLHADGPNYDEGNLVELLLTEKCNLACAYCLAGANQKMPAMDRDIAFRTIDLAMRMKTDTLAFEFAGGEPFIKFALMRETADYIENHPDRGDRRIFLSVQTNATLLDEEKVRWLRDRNVRVGISLDGGAQAQNRSRPQVNGKESHSRLMRGIKLLQDGQVPFGGLVVLNRSNIQSPRELAEFLIEHSIHGVRLNPVAYLGTARANWATIGLAQEEIIAFFKELMRMVVEERLPLLEDNVRSMLDFLTSKQRRTRCMRAACGAGDTFQSIAANGDIYPCGRSTQSPGLRLGNVLDPALPDLAEAAASSERIAELRTRRPQGLGDCGTCAYRQLCQSGCSVQAWERYGTLRAKTPECAFYKTLYPYWMRWISHDARAFAHLESMSYFNYEGARFDVDFLPAARPVHVAA